MPPPKQCYLVNMDPSWARTDDVLSFPILNRQGHRERLILPYIFQRRLRLPSFCAKAVIGDAAAVALTVATAGGASDSTRTSALRRSTSSTTGHTTDTTGPPSGGVGRGGTPKKWGKDKDALSCGISLRIRMSCGAAKLGAVASVYVQG